VLSDPRERSWYDSHRDEILRGDDGDEDGDGEAYVVNVWPYFSGSAFSGYGDGAGGFYEVYRGVFEVRAVAVVGWGGWAMCFVFGVGMRAAVRLQEGRTLRSNHPVSNPTHSTTITGGGHPRAGWGHGRGR
jgi:hypothetical protein